MTRKLLIIGVSGVTCGGKTTIARALRGSLPKCKMISQDDYFRSVDDPLHVWIPELNHINFDIITALDMEKMYADIIKITEGKDINFTKKQQNILPSFSSPKELQRYVHSKIEGTELEVLIIEGFCIFNYKPVLPFFHLKYYFTLPEDECKNRRDKRVYDPPDCPGYFEKCVWPEHLKQLQEVRNTLQDVTYFSGMSDENPLEAIMLDLLMFL